MNRIFTLLLLFAFNVAVAQDSTCFDWGGNVNIGIESGKFNQKQSLSYLSSAFVKGLKSWNNNELQWNIHLAVLGAPNFVQRNIDSIGVIPFFHQPIYHSNKSAILLLPELSYKRKIGKYFILKAGNERLHVSPGYRSMIFSNQAGALPQLGLITTIGKFKFYNAWARTKHFNADSGEKLAKYVALHGLKWQFNSKWSAEITEMVTWQTRDSSSRRELDLHYLNPFLFYRPVEYAQGSADNVLMSAQVIFQPTKYFKTYGQFLLDEFLLREVRNRSGWWGNKFGGLIGLQAISKKTKGLIYQSEWSFARPYTYTHGSEAQAWGHWNTPFAHPLGANFYEWWQRVQYAKDKWSYDIVGAWSAFGRDPNYNVGGNIFQSYKAPWQQYNNFILQGVRSTLLILDAQISYSLTPEWQLSGLFRWRSLRSRDNPFDEQWIMVGIKKGLALPMRWDF